MLDGPYLKATHKHKFLCLTHGEIHEISVTKLRCGTSMWCCYIARKRSKFGKNHWRYNHRMSEKERLELYNRYVIPGYQKWMRDIKRLGYCELCFSKVNLVAHHFKKSYKECSIREKVDIANGKCLCRKCHNKFHKTYGKTGFTIKDWQAFEATYK